MRRPDDRPRVLHVGKFYPPSRGGMEKVVQVLCEAERATLNSQVLVANQGRATVRELVNGVPVTRAGSWTQVGAVALCPTFPFWMQRLQGDVMVVHEPNPVAIVAHALVRPTSKLVVWIHAEVVRPQWRYRAFYRPFLRRLLTRADRVIVASPPMVDVAVELQDFREKTVVIPYGIDPNQHRLDAAVAEQMRRIQAASASASASTSPSPLVLFVGRLVPYKGVDVLLRALQHVDAHAVLVGEGPQRAALQQMAGDLGIAHRVRFAGDVDQTTLTALYHACDVFALPSVTHAEAFGMVQLEAMACRKPVVSTRLPSGVPWVNRDGDSGLVVTPGDADGLAGALRTLLADKELRARMGERGHARVVREFTIERMAAQTTALYHEVLGRGAAGQATRGASVDAHAADGATLDTRPARRTA